MHLNFETSAVYAGFSITGAISADWPTAQPIRYDGNLNYQEWPGQPRPFIGYDSGTAHDSLMASECSESESAAVTSDLDFTIHIPQIVDKSGMYFHLLYKRSLCTHCQFEKYSLPLLVTGRHFASVSPRCRLKRF